MEVHGLLLITSFVILVVSVVAAIGMTVLIWSIYRKMSADDAAIFLQGRRIEEVIREMRAELSR
jgi:hypothetical protein